MFTSVPTERRNSPFRTHLFRGWSVCTPQISKRGMAHILEMYALDEGLKALQKTGGVPIIVYHPKSGTPPGSAINKGFLVIMYGRHPNPATPFWSACTPGKYPMPPGDQNGKRSQMPLGVKHMFSQQIMIPCTQKHLVFGSRPRPWSVCSNGSWARVGGGGVPLPLPGDTT